MRVARAERRKQLMNIITKTDLANNKFNMQSKKVFPV